VLLVVKSSADAETELRHARCEKAGAELEGGNAPNLYYGV
jgi:hypothetical protein